MFDELDSDKDGKLTYQDFVNLEEIVVAGDEMKTLQPIALNSP